VSSCLSRRYRAGVREVIRVAIVDDQQLVRSGLRALIERAEDIDVVGEAADGSSAVRLARSLRPDIVLMDVRMPGVDGVEATRRITTDPGLHTVRVIVLTTFQDDEVVLDAVRAGASGFVLKDTSPDDLRAAIREVADGNALLSPAVTRTVLAELAAGGRPDPRARARLGDLAEREREVLRAVARGLSNDEIAADLHLSPATARTYVSRLLTKLDVRDRAQLVVLAYTSGFVNDGG
jgi:DNA-binding NarL/FixJ family response regulator